MGKPTGFLEYERKDGPVTAPKERIKNFKEFHGQLPEEEQRLQGARCMECGVPFCQAGTMIAGMASGCPLHNLVPEVNDLVWHGNWEQAYVRLSKTHCFPEFTSRVCPALCEAACTCGLHAKPVSTKENERAVIEYAYANGLVKGEEPKVRTGKKVAVIGSALFGMISGSSSANVVASGTFTIPMMIKTGYSPRFSAAVESVASTGGQMMPPIMGAAAFIMADVIGVSYLTIAKAALIPSVLYYLTLLAIIHLEAVSKNMGTLPPELVPSAASVLRRLYYLFPLVFLITILLMGRSVIACAYYGTVCIVILSMIRSETRFTFKRLCGALELSAKNAMMVSSCCACAGIIIGVISLTGIGYKFINVITALAGSNLLLLMAMLMVTCIILGMGVPTAPAYIIVATLGAPALMKAGVPIIAAHMFVYFYAILSVITPPVCLAA